ncbi:hypothetical protein GOZ83_06420 [Agrobacterium vitis]|uniref:hypothetical protein n=1 Tax=Rhizobium/Agrobacterium group TaxID=227290 RepID=UPI0012E7E64D|nr:MULTISPECIES: hypothetical protein [Rhizobium/Agrobacterium group]MCF1492672.1 hypothetical protein [Allorhizobium ampelinum]MVA44716.1 hypothetical protein [Agrobacterium vitis]
MGLLSQIQRNAIDGAARETVALAQLEKLNPGSRIFTQRYLRDANGKIVKDPVTGEGRRLDIVVVKGGKGTSYEITSQTAPKLLQLQKEGRILDAGGNYIRAPGTKELIPVEGLSKVMRLD